MHGQMMVGHTMCKYYLVRDGNNSTSMGEIV